MSVYFYSKFHMLVRAMNWLIRVFIHFSDGHECPECILQRYKPIIALIMVAVRTSET